MKLSKELSGASSPKAMRENQVPAKPCMGTLGQLTVVDNIPTVHSDLKEQDYLSSYARKEMAEYFFNYFGTGVFRATVTMHLE